MYKLDLPLDRRQEAAIERRKNQEEARKSRIFNAKIRTIGIDVNAIEQQVKDKKNKEERERLRSEAFAADAVRSDKIALLLEQRQDHDRQEIDKADVEYRQLNQKPEGTREWDLNDPDRLKKDKPARVSDDDPRCGLASLQRFEGEDTNTKARKAFQTEQNRDWLDAQAAEKEERLRLQAEADRIYELKRLQLDQRALQLQMLEEETRKQVKVATDAYNQALHQDYDERRARAKQAEEDDNLTDIANHIYGDVLTENPDAARSAFGPHRVAPDRWKGMTADQLSVIADIQAKQVKENARLREEERKMDMAWDRQRVMGAKVALLKEQHQMEKMKGIRANQDEKNVELAKEQKDQKEYMDNVVYTNPPTAHYFTQFNTTTR